MTICRLCISDKNVDDLVISLQETVVKFDCKFTFAEYVEYYCKLSLKPNQDLPQRVCRSCKVSIEKFADFSFNVEKNQKTLIDKLTSNSNRKTEPVNKIQEQIPKVEFSDDGGLLEVIDIDDTASEDERNQPVASTSELAAHKKSAIPQEKEKQIGKSERDEEPVEKRQKLSNEVAEANLLKLPVERLKAIPARRKSVYEDGSNERKKLSYRLHRVNSLFGEATKSQLKYYEHIEISLHKLLDDGEVPEKWLCKYKDFKTWKDLSFKCSGHCDINFDNLFSLISHNYENLKDTEHNITCQFCDKTCRGIYSTVSFVNHMTRYHKHQHMQFCCITCSKVFYNMPYLFKHYQVHHPTVRLLMFPCVQCGFYCQSLSQLTFHKQRHHNENKKI